MLISKNPSSYNNKDKKRPQSELNKSGLNSELVVWFNPQKVNTEWSL